MKRRTFVGRLWQSFVAAFGAVAAVFSGCEKPQEKGPGGEPLEEAPSEPPKSEPGVGSQAPPPSRGLAVPEGDELEDDFGGGGQIDGGSHGRGVSC